MDAISTLQDGLQWAHELLEMVMADVTPEQAHWQPPGIASPLGAIYAHAVLAEDAVINAMLKGGARYLPARGRARPACLTPNIN